jgi:YD repeat-containing protein
LGNQTVHHFSVANHVTATASPADYSLPITCAVTDSTGTRCLSRESYDCDEGGSGCALVRSFFLAWEQDESCSALTGNCYDTNRRVISRRTVYHDDPAGGGERFAEATFDDFDGLGHFRVTTEDGNFGEGDFEQTTLGYNPAAGTYTPGAPAGFTMRSTTSPWYLEELAFKEVSDGTDSERFDNCVDAYGRVVRQRLRRDPSPSTSDVIVASAWTGGNVVEEAYYGGDVQPVPASSNPCASLPGSPQYRIRSTYAFGALATREYLEAGGSPLPFRSVDRDIDPNTALPAASRDVSGLATTYEYDLRGRQTWQRPETRHGAYIQRVYDAPTGGSQWVDGPKTTTHRRPNGGGAPLTTEVTWLDVFGNLSGEQTLLPDGSRSRKRYEHDALGNLSMESSRFVADVGAPIYWTFYLAYDPFGRVRTIRPPEGAEHDRVLSYKGEREVRTTTSAAYWHFPSPINDCAENPVTYTTLYDRQGRKHLEIENRPKPLPGLSRETEYTFGPNGRVVRSERRDTVGTTTETSTSDFVWDGRGFLLSQTARDPFWTVLERVEFSDYDARGNHHRRLQDGLFHPSPVEVSLTYDAAERLLRVTDATEPAKKWKEFTYGTENILEPGGGDTIADARLGRLVTAVRHNHWESPTLWNIVIQEDYSYGGPGGLLSEISWSARKEIYSSVVWLKRYVQSVDYDDLGQILEAHHPHCELCAEGEPALARETFYQYSGSFLNGASGDVDGVPQNWVGSMTYGASLEPTEIAHVNGVRDVLNRDPYGRDFLASLQVTGAHVAYDSGPIAYDGEETACGVGNQSLVVAPLPADPGPTPPLPCIDAHTIDPFLQHSGEIADPSCNFTGALPSRSVFDASDRKVGFFDTRARKRVLWGGEWIWVADPDNFTTTWTLYGVSGDLLREVQETTDGAWRYTLDSIPGAGSLLGRAKNKTYPSGWFIRHAHPAGHPGTNPQGYPRTDLDSY